MLKVVFLFYQSPSHTSFGELGISVQILLINEYYINLLEVRIICTTCALSFSSDVHVVCLLILKSISLGYVHFRLSMIPLDLQDDSDVAKSDVFSEVQ